MCRFLEIKSTYPKLTQIQIVKELGGSDCIRNDIEQLSKLGAHIGDFPGPLRFLDEASEDIKGPHTP